MTSFLSLLCLIVNLILSLHNAHIVLLNIYSTRCHNLYLRNILELILQHQLQLDLKVEGATENPAETCSSHLSKC